jgi:hypothetical protein
MALHQLNPPDSAENETAMSAAMRASGAEQMLPDRKLAALAREACLAHVGKRNAQRNHIAEALRNDLTFVLMHQFEAAAYGKAVGRLLDREQAIIDAEKPTRAAAAATATATRSAVQPKEPQEPVTSWERNMDSNVQPITSWDRDGRFANDEARRIRQANALTRTAVRLSKLDEFTVNGRPIGDVTPDEANSFAARRERDARFIRALTAGLPLGMDKPIRHYRTADESDTLFAEAEKARIAT